MENIDELLKTELSSIRWNPFLWYNVPKEASTLEISEDNIESLKSQSDKAKLYDYVAILGHITEEKIKLAADILKPSGVLIMAADNRYGYKYWSKPIKDERESEKLSREQIESLIITHNLHLKETHYPIPDYRLPIEIYSEKRLPKPGSIDYVVPEYVADRYSVASDAETIDKLCMDGVFQKYAASLIWICIKAGEDELDAKKKPEILYTKYTAHRAPQYRLMTMITLEEGVKRVYKKALTLESREQIESICKNYELLRDVYKSIELLPVARIDEDTVSFDYIEGMSLLDEVDFRNITKESIDSLITQISEKIDIVLDVRDNTHSNLDPILTNFIRTDKGIICMDYEWVSDAPVSMEYLKYRILTYMYTAKYSELKDVVTTVDFLKKFGYSEADIKSYNDMEDEFQCRVHGEKRKYIYIDKYKKQIKLPTDMAQEIEQLKNYRENQKKLLIEKDELIDRDTKLIREYYSALTNPIDGLKWWLRKLTHRGKTEKPQDKSKYESIRARDESGDRTWLESYESEIKEGILPKGKPGKMCGNIDSISVGEYIVIEGWAFIRGRRDNNDLEPQIILSNDEHTYIISTTKTYRRDVQVNNPVEKDVEFTGMVCRFSSEKIESGVYDVTINLDGKANIYTERKLSY